MIAFDWQWAGPADPTAARLAQALAAGTGRAAGAASAERYQAAALLPFADQRRARGWAPVVVGPLLVLFAGHIDNAREVAGLLSADYPGDRPDPALLARLYGAARLAWGDAADLRLIGEYAAILFDAEGQVLRLVRSPLRAPPLHVHRAAGRVIAASVPRAIFACGVPQRINAAKLADNALFNPGSDRTGWFEGLDYVPLGTELRIDPAGTTERRYYDLYSLPKVRLDSDAEYLEAAHGLLAEGTRAALRGARRPAIMLSGGLDSPQVAAKALAALPAGSQLHAFTFTPEPGWDGYVGAGQFGDERPVVAAFAAQHPGLVTHFEDNAGSGFDAGMAELFLRDGQTRWLAREMARGIMPEAQRLEVRHGRHGADWHLKLTRRRSELLAELERLAQNERLSAMIDFPKIRHALEDWPESGAIPVEERLLREGAIPRAVMLARYINHVEGHNQ